MARALTIYYDEFSVAANKINLGPRFEDLDVLAKADILKDCVALMVALYNNSVEDLQNPENWPKKKEALTPEDTKILPIKYLMSLNEQS